MAAVVIEHDITNNTQPQTQLDRMAVLLDNVELAVIALTRDGRIIAWNRAAGRLYGWSAEAAVGQPIADLLKAGLDDERRAAIRGAITEHDRWRGELAVTRRDGTPVVVDVMHVAAVDHRGRTTGYLSIHRDLSDEKRWAADLEAARAHADEILDRISDVVFAVDRRWRYTYLNRRAVERVRQAGRRGATAEELIGQSCWEVFPDWAGSSIRDVFEQAVREQRPVHTETYVPAARSWFDVRLYPSDTGLSVYLCDITAHRRATEQLAYHARLLENLDDAVVATDAEGTVTAWNGGAERMFGWGRSQAVGRSITETVIRGRQAPAFAEVARELNEVGRRHTVETRYRRDGSPVLTDSVTVALRDDREELTGYLGIARDVSERESARLEIERGLTQQAAVADLGLRALRDYGIPALLVEAARAVQRGLGVEYSRVDELLPGGVELRIRAGVGWPAGVLGNVVGAGRGSASGYALLTGRPVIVDDVGTETRFAIPSLTRAQGIRSQIAVAIDPLRKPFGTLVALSRHERSFSEHDASFMQSVANVLADAIDRAALSRRLEAAREAERSRIARDLHDEALRELTDVIALATLSPTRPEDGDEERWKALMGGLRGVGRQLRSAIYDLRTTSDEERAFADLLADVVSGQAEIAGAIAVRLRGEAALPVGSLGPDGGDLLRVVREAITNARRHSGGTVISIDTGESTEGIIRIEIADDGDWPGRRDAVHSRRTAGLAGMFDGADRLGASLWITHRRDGGTRVLVELPLSDRSQEDGTGDGRRPPPTSTGGGSVSSGREG